ncbi:cell wall-binding repeat-containing protein [Stomatohabitans albus]|uniref:cell wall-binding repeat-containing protein n=1 Tax=Stomatohabitans albus TaxID=3110766 RepID=UPI00300D3257
MNWRIPMAALAVSSALTATQASAWMPADDHGSFSIVNGQDEDPLTYPEVVAISVPLMSGGGATEDCGGTVINDRWILSAAHCFHDWNSNFPVTVRVQTAFSQAASGDVYARPIVSSSVFAHPQFADDFNAGGPTRGKYDVALVRLSEPISSTTPIDPNTLQVHPRRDANPVLKTVTLDRAGADIPRSGNGIVVGRGAKSWVPGNAYVGIPGHYDSVNTQLRSAQIPVQSGCRSDYHVCAGNRIDEKTLQDLPEQERHLDTKHRLPSSCVGDSGGPLFITAPDGTHTQVGIISHGRFNNAAQTFWSNDTCGRVATWFTSIAYVRPWIDAVIAANPSTPADLPQVSLKVPPYSDTTPAPTPPGAGSPPPPSQSLPPGGAAPDAPGSEPNTPPPTPDPSEPERPLGIVPTYPDDPPLLKQLPQLRNGDVTWPIAETTQEDGSVLSVGVARLRAASERIAVRNELGGRKTALLASEQTMADALASGVLQRNTTLFLTDPTELEPLVAKELAHQAFTDVWILGGEQAIAPGVERALSNLGYHTQRIAGEDRTQTAIEIANQAVALQANTPKGRFLSRAYGDKGDETRSWADAIALGALSARMGKPILLSPQNAITENVANRLTEGVPVTLVGGPNALAPEVEILAATLTGIPTARIAGENRAGTAGAIATNFTKPTHAYIIDGQQHQAWQLGFSLAGLAGENNAPILLVAGKTVPPETRETITKLGINNLFCFADQVVCRQLQP